MRGCRKKLAVEAAAAEAVALSLLRRDPPHKTSSRRQQRSCSADRKAAAESYPQQQTCVEKIAGAFCSGSTIRSNKAQVHLWRAARR
mmetsp:Transcript_96170/g.276286  ORF Transcript_96170/g.276286 Transcript_96170/m.276286 type:complete len:87 (+) Transcript_96170:1160-1420(+)